MKSIILLLFCVSSFLFAKDKLYVCAIFHNEARFLDEWIDFHLNEGAEKIYLYNHQSDDDYMKVLYKYLSTKKLELIDWNISVQTPLEWNAIQCAAYKDCITKVKNKCEWLAVIDTDEFLFSPMGTKIHELLNNYNEFDQIGVNWVIYGTSYIDELEEGAKITQHMVFRAPTDNKNVKSIVRPNKVIDCINPHYFIMKDPSKTVNENKIFMEGPFSPHSSYILRINHYWTRDRKFLFSEKLRRQILWWGVTQEELERRDNKFSQIYDPILREWH